MPGYGGTQMKTVLPIGETMATETPGWHRGHSHPAPNANRSVGQGRDLPLSSSFAKVYKQNIPLYNRMMVYVENHAYQNPNNEEMNKE